MNFRIVKREESGKLLRFLSRRLFYHIEWITILETMGVTGKHYRFYAFEDPRNEGYAAILFVGKKYANLYVSKESDMDEGVILRCLDELLLNKELEYLYFNAEVDMESILPKTKIPGAPITNQYILSHCVDKNLVKNALSRQERIVLNRCEEFDIEELLFLHRSCFGSALSQSAYRLLLHSGAVKPYYIREGGDIVCKGEWILNSRKIGYISGICTGENFRNKGFCSSLIGKMVEDIEGCGRVALINCESQDLKTFYIRLGFRCDDMRRKLWLRI